jgi:flagellar motility protein MotE (MotC chaperone)
MIRTLQSPWVTVLAGCLLYLGTMLTLLHTDKLATDREPPSDRSAADAPSWKFKNPEFDQWIAQMKLEKEALGVREQQLNELQSRLDAERQEITTVTQTVAQLQADFDRNVIRFSAQAADNVKRQAKLVAAMSPEGAAAMFKEMPDDDVVRILFTMKTDEASLILDTISKVGKPEARRAAALTERLRQVLPVSTNLVSTAAP